MSESETIGVINPRALAEQVVGRRIRWNRIVDQESYLEDALQTPFERLFDPKHKSVLYAGLERRADGLWAPVASADRAASLQRLAIPGARRRTAVSRRYGIDHQRVRATLSQMLSPGTSDAEWNPDNTDWVDMGDFFEEGCEFGDPEQGGLADCYLIAAMGAIAWARPYVIAHRTRQSGPGQEDLLDRVDVWEDDQWHSIEVTEEVPVIAGSHQWRYARSTEGGEIWPAIVEKAYAKWKTGTATDRPDYNEIAFGSATRACKELLGGTRHSISTSGSTVDDLWHYVRSHCLSRRTFDPMVAWTYGSADNAPDDIEYGSSSGIAANHAYTVLGWWYTGGQKYIVLRNPWAWFVPSANVATGNWPAYDQSYWLSVPLGTNGVFAFEISEFKKHYAGVGYVS